MKILTLNTHSWLELHQLHKIRVLADFILSEDIDIIALQEVNQLIKAPFVETDHLYRPLTERPITFDNFALLLAQFLQEDGRTYYWSWAESHEGWGIYDEGVALLSKHPFNTLHTVHMSDPQYDYKNVYRRCALAACININQQDFWFASTHMNWWEREGKQLFRHDFDALNQQLQALAHHSPIILAGDFNNDAGIPSEGYAQMLEAGWADTYTQAKHVDGEYTVHKNIAGWENSTEAKRIDFILTKGLNAPVLRHRVVFADNTPEAISDHSGVLVEIAL
ncbi:endonuclease/exonuclease/phosphatase family protein [Rothia sp. CCM 9419]|uniref:endonuclease/exonuclease/phosphatase family protein n=1 Tax=Rothia sp. CCM 9419 TaxID=3402662 RepID=UPI003AECD29D